MWPFFLFKSTLGNDTSLAGPFIPQFCYVALKLYFHLNGGLITVMMSPTPTILPPPGLCVCVFVCVRVGKHSDSKALITADSLGKDNYTNRENNGVHFF